MCLFHLSAALAVIAVWARRDHVRPHMFAAHMTWHYVIDRQPAVALPTILAGIIITPKDFPARQFDVRARSMNLTLEPDDRGARDQVLYRSDMTAAVYNHASLACQEQTDRPSCSTDVDRFEIGVEH
jgi:hypothetical protein